MSYTREDAEFYLDEHLPEKDVYSFDEVVDACVEFAQSAQEVVTVDCKRCGKVFPSVDSVEYCSVGCELGYAPGTWWR